MENEETTTTLDNNEINDILLEIESDYIADEIKRLQKNV